MPLAAPAFALVRFALSMRATQSADSRLSNLDLPNNTCLRSSTACRNRACATLLFSPTCWLRERSPVGTKSQGRKW